MKIIKIFFSFTLVIAACAAIGFAQTAGDKDATKSSTSNSTTLPKGWQIYSLGSKDTFKVAMPKKPEIESEEMKGIDKPIKITYFTSSSDEILTVIADIYDLPINSNSLSDSDKLGLFKNIREGLVSGMKSELDKNGIKSEIKFSPQKSVALRGASGYEQDFTVGSIKGRSRMLSIKDHIYIFFTILLEDSKESLMNDFLDSFDYSGAK